MKTLVLKMTGYAIIVAGLPMAATPGWAQQGRGGSADTAVAVMPLGWGQHRGLGKQLVGTWSLVAVTNEDAGKITTPFGPHPLGYMTISSKGRFSIQIARAGAPGPVAGNRMTGSADENKAGVQSIAYFGTYRLDEKQRTIDLHIEASTSPDPEGTEQKRLIAFSGDELTVTNPPAAAGGTTKTVWKRIK